MSHYLAQYSKNVEKLNSEFVEAVKADLQELKDSAPGIIKKAILHIDKYAGPNSHQYPQAIELVTTDGNYFVDFDGHVDDELKKVLGDKFANFKKSAVKIIDEVFDVLDVVKVTTKKVRV